MKKFGVRGESSGERGPTCYSVKALIAVPSVPNRFDFRLRLRLRSGYQPQNPVTPVSKTACVPAVAAPAIAQRRRFCQRREQPNALVAVAVHDQTKIAVALNRGARPASACGRPENGFGFSCLFHLAIPQSLLRRSLSGKRTRNVATKVVRFP
jgi:hypothetical protein